MKTSPTQRTLKALRASGHVCQIVEHFNPHVRIRQDAFGFGDILAIRAPRYEPQVIAPDGAALMSGWSPARILMVQACVGDSHAARRTKILAEPRALTWLQAGGELEIWSWSKKGARGKRKLWEQRVERIMQYDFAVATATHESCPIQAAALDDIGEP